MADKFTLAEQHVIEVWERHLQCEFWIPAGRRTR